MCQAMHADDAVAERRLVVKELYLRGWDSETIADRLEVSPAVVESDIQAIQKKWRETAIDDVLQARDKEQRKLDLIEREAWSGWERSLKLARSKKRGDGRTTETADEPTGDLRFLMMVHKCIVHRCSLLNLDEPVAEKKS